MRDLGKACLLGALLLGVVNHPAIGQSPMVLTSAGAPRYGAPQASRYRVGASIFAKRGTVQRIMAMVAVPFPCNEQQVEILEEDVTEHLDSLTYRDLAGGAKQMLLKIGRLPSGEEAHAIITFEVRTCAILPPQETSHLVIPKKPDRNLKKYLGKSPYIEVGHRKIRAAVTEALEKLEKDATDWQQVEAIYDYVQQKIDYLEGPDKSAVQALTDRQGDCQAISALFVAMCRTKKIPARIVWVHEHNYPEFYLEEGSMGEPGTKGGSPAVPVGSEVASTPGGSDSAGTSKISTESKNLKGAATKKRVRASSKKKPVGHWYPCESSGRRAFGEMPLTRTILQKGDNFRIPERPRERLRYASDYLTGLPTPGGGKPAVRYIREQL